MPARRNIVGFRCTRCGRIFRRHINSTRCCDQDCHGLLIRWPLRSEDLGLWFEAVNQIRIWQKEERQGKGDRPLRERITGLFKRYFVRRREGQCQVLFALTELDGLVGEILEEVGRQDGQAQVSPQQG